MKLAIFSTKKYEQTYFEQLNQQLATPFALDFFEARLSAQTAQLAQGFNVISCFVNDQLDAATLTQLAKLGIKGVALRCAGFNNVKLDTAKQLGITITRVPAYSPYSVAEFGVGLILTLNRKIHKAYLHNQQYNFSLQGLMGFDLHGKTVGIIGTGKIGAVFAKIMLGFGCHCLAYDPVVNPHCEQMGVKYLSLTELYQQSDIISLHCPLTAATQHLINAQAIDQMKPGVMLINTGRGALMDAKALIQAIKTKKIGYLGMDVYEEEEQLFFEDHSEQIINDDIFARLQTFPNVLITGHQAFFTKEALHNIISTTLDNAANLLAGTPINTV